MIVRCIVLSIVLSGCQPALMNLDVPVMVECAEIPVPPPIPEHVYIRLYPGSLETNDGGEYLLRQYAGMRSYIKSIQ